MTTLIICFLISFIALCLYGTRSISLNALYFSLFLSLLLITLSNFYSPDQRIQSVKNSPQKAAFENLERVQNKIIKQKNPIISNSLADDIELCEDYLAFLSSKTPISQDELKMRLSECYQLAVKE